MIHSKTTPQCSLLGRYYYQLCPIKCKHTFIFSFAYIVCLISLNIVCRVCEYAVYLSTHILYLSKTMTHVSREFTIQTKEIESC